MLASERELLLCLADANEKAAVAIREHGQAREQTDNLMVHLLAVSLGEILAKSQEKHVEVMLPNSIPCIYAANLGRLLASRGFVTYAQLEHEQEWVIATPRTMSRSNFVVGIAISTQASDVEDEANAEAIDRIRQLERELHLAKEAQSHTKRKRVSQREVSTQERKRTGMLGLVNTREDAEL